jgi:vibriolysin
LSNKILKTFCAAWLGLTFTGCATEEQVAAEEVTSISDERDGTDIQQALTSLGNVTVLANQKDGVTPAFIKGDLGRMSAGLRAGDEREVARQIAPVFRMRAEDLVFKRASKDAQGHTYLRYGQTKNGLPVMGAELILFVNTEGAIYAANSSAYDLAPGLQAAIRPGIAAEAAEVAALGGESQLRANKTDRLVYVQGDNGRLILAHEVRVTGERNGLPVEDLVYVNAATGERALINPRIHTALNRAVHSANNGTSLPGTLRRGEGGAATNDVHIDENYVHLGTTYDCYQANFNRDSYNNAGAQLKSTVHYSSNYVNAFWNGTQMVYGDGNNVDSGMLGRDLDVTVHELTHAVTENESNLIYSGESGALNEGMSDIFAAYCESWTRSWATDADVWKIGEDIWTPGTAGDALRYMANPTQDGSSKDYYPERYTGSSDNGGVHWNSGIANLAFKLLSTGGTHPRAKTTVNVTGIGVQAAGRIFYEANANCMTQSSNFVAAKACTEQKASAAELASVTAAWEAVGVGGAPPPPPPTVTLTNDVPVSNLSGTTGDVKNYKLTVPTGQASLVFTTSGGTGDVDLYVRRGSAPTTSAYDCRPYLSGNAETCTFNSPVAGDYYVMLHAYASFSGVTLKGTYGAAPPPSNVLTNGVATAPYSGAASSWKCFTLSVPAGKTSVAFAQAGGTGDADLYVRLGSQPTTTSYTCRSQGSTNTDSCSVANPTAGTYYACSYAYSAYSNTTMKGTY